MNTTVTQLPDSHSANPGGPHKSHGRRGRLAALIASIGAALAVSLAGAGAASADTVPGYGTGSASITCGFGVYIQAQMSPDNRYWSDRFYVRNVKTGVGNWYSWHQNNPATWTPGISPPRPAPTSSTCSMRSGTAAHGSTPTASGSPSISRHGRDAAAVLVLLRVNRPLLHPKGWPGCRAAPGWARASVIDEGLPSRPPCRLEP